MKEVIDKQKIPAHIAIIMDGNGRWAKKKGAARIFGHQNAIKAVRESTEFCGEVGVKHLTLYAFSTENWGRPKDEVNGLMSLLVQTINSELSSIKKNNVKFSCIGDINGLSQNARTKIIEAIDETSENTGLNLNIAINYSGRWEIVEAVKAIMNDEKNGILSMEDLSVDIFSKYLNTQGIPDPELLIRTSGELRISNFMLWQLAYTEIYVTDILWPDFRKADLVDAINAYQMRERRFGKISEGTNL